MGVGMPRKKKFENMSVKELLEEHRALLDQAEEDYKKSRAACADFYEEHVKPALRKRDEENKKLLKARDSIDRSLIIAREKAQSELNKARRKRNELLRDLSWFDTRYKASKNEEDKRILEACSSEIKRMDVEITALERKFTSADKEVTQAVKEALESLAV